ncbi:MAG: head GIN domain-containing protein [Bacteroidota bacterium]
MKTTAILLFSSALVSFVYLTSCTNFHAIEGNHNVVTETRNISSFTELRSEGSYDVYLIHDSVFYAQVEAEENLLPYIITEISGGELVIKTHEHKNLKNHTTIKIFVHAPSANSLTLEGSGKIDCDSISEDNLKIFLDGSGNIFLGKAECDKIKTKISGSGEVDLSGTANETDFNISGSGDINSYNLVQDTCYADISGSGDMYINVNKFLDVHITGSGTVHYYGTPVVNSDITGSGMVIHE